MKHMGLNDGLMGFHGGFMGFDGSYPFVKVYITMEN